MGWREKCLIRAIVQKPTAMALTGMGAIAQRASMKVIILNWSEGENDPFTFFSTSLAKIFIRCGKTVEVLEITDKTWPERIYQIDQTEGVEFVYTWQGISTNSLLSDELTNVWDRIKVPIISFHGDHPSYKPDNHRLDNPNSIHLYAHPDFARYANRHFRRNSGACLIDFPRIYAEELLPLAKDQCFNFVKNIKHTDDIEATWRKELPTEAARVYQSVGEILKYLIDSEKYVEIHDVMDALILSEQWTWINEAVNPGILHHYHSELDYYVRSYRSMRALDQLRDIPVHIYGRGWDKYKSNASKQWRFFDGIDMAESQKLYYNQYGIIDISPSKRLHDRAMRAMANGQSFLSSALLDDSFEDLSPYESIFFDFRKDNLRDHCERVMADPDAHRVVSKQFANHYHQLFHFSEFVSKLEMIAMNLRIKNDNVVSGV
jgi:hypothetical protein